MSKLVIPLNEDCDESYEVVLNSTIEVGAKFPVVDQTLQILHRSEPISSVRLVDDSVLTPEKLRGLADQLDVAINDGKACGLKLASVEETNRFIKSAKTFIVDMKQFKNAPLGLTGVILAEYLARKEGLTIYSSEAGFVTSSSKAAAQPEPEVQPEPSPATDCQTVSENSCEFCGSWCDDNDTVCEYCYNEFKPLTAETTWKYNI